MVEMTVTFPNWGTALVVILGAITINATLLFGVYEIGKNAGYREAEEPSEPAEEPVLCNASRYIGGVFYMCDMVGDHDIHVDEAAGVTWRAR